MSDEEQTGLVKTVLERIDTDREELKELYERIYQNSAQDPFALAGVSENLVKIADTLCKQNQQLIELAKLEAKQKRSPTQDESGVEDTDSIYDEIKGNA